MSEEEPKPDHFLADFHDLPDLSLLFEERLQVDYKKVPSLKTFPSDNPPFSVITTSWYYLMEWDPLTKQSFDIHLQGAVENQIKLLTKEAEKYEDEVLEFYPFTHYPPTKFAVAYHHFGGATTPIECRLVMNLGQHVFKGNAHPSINFHLVNLTKKPNYGK